MCLIMMRWMWGNKLRTMPKFQYKCLNGACFRLSESLCFMEWIGHWGLWGLCLSIEVQIYDQPKPPQCYEQCFLLTFASTVQCKKEFRKPLSGCWNSLINRFGLQAAPYLKRSYFTHNVALAPFSEINLTVLFRASLPDTMLRRTLYTNPSVSVKRI